MPSSAQNFSERLIAMDILRGFALLGILFMNIQSFAMPSAAYLNPTAFGDLTGLNQWAWMVSHVIADQKFMTIFSMLFGAGVLLFCSYINLILPCTIMLIISIPFETLTNHQ